MFRANEESRVTVKVRVEWDGDSWIARCSPLGGREVIAAVSGEYDGCSGQDPEPDLDALERAALQEMSDSLRRRDLPMDELRLVAEIDAASGERWAETPAAVQS